MITALYWPDATSDTYPLAWSNFNDFDDAMAWLAKQRKFYRAGFIRIFRRNTYGRNLLMHQESWTA
jgi:hypothetical protein